MYRAGAANRHHRCAVDQRVGHAGGEINHAGAAGGHAHTGLLQQAAIGLCGERRRLLVTHVDHPDALLGARRFGVLHRPAHDVKNVLGAFVL